MLLVLLLSLVAVCAGGCRQWRCRPFKPGICAEWTPAFVYVNVDACPEQQTCSLLELLPLMSWHPSGQLRCTGKFLPHSSQALNCKLRDPLAALAAPHAQRCESDSECLLQNGSTGRCACALDGYSYCKLSEGDAELDGFYQSCESMNGTQAFSWYLVIDLAHTLPGPQWCVKKLFEEVPYLLDFLREENITSFANIGKEYRGPD